MHRTSAGHLVFDSVLDCFLLSCSFCDVYSDFLKKFAFVCVIALRDSDLRGVEIGLNK